MHQYTKNYGHTACIVLNSSNSRYLDKDEVDYYMEKIDKEQLRCKESYSQVIQVIYEKQKQPKFKNANKSYQRKCLINFVFTKNLQEYGWDIKAYSQDGRTIKRETYPSSF